MKPFEPPIGGLPELLGMQLVDYGKDWLEMSMTIEPAHLRPDGIELVHAGAIIALADTTCGYGTRIQLPQQAEGFVTMELKSNLLGNAGAGKLICRAEAKHTGRRTQVWHAEVREAGKGKKIALYQCTQLII